MITVDVAPLTSGSLSVFEVNYAATETLQCAPLRASTRIINQRIPVTWYEGHSCTDTRSRTWWILHCYDIKNYSTNRDISLKTKVNFCN